MFCCRYSNTSHYCMLKSSHNYLFNIQTGLFCAQNGRLMWWPQQYSNTLKVVFWIWLEIFLIIGLFFICVAARLEWCHLHLSVFLPLDPPSLAWWKKKKLSWLMDLLAIWTSVFSFIVLAGRGLGTGWQASTIAWTNTGFEASLWLKPQRLVIRMLSI